MKILLTNDDGYKAKGIRELARETAARGHDVKIVAPERQRSAASHAVTLHKPLRLDRVKSLDHSGVEVWRTSGTPVDSAMLGLLKVMPDADLLISGINSGPNLGEDVIYSGTVGAAMEGALIGVRSIAASITEFGIEEYELAARFTASVAEQIVELDLPKSTVININVPPVKPDEYKGYRVVPLGTRKYRDVLQKRTDPRGRDYYWIAGDIIRDYHEEDTDNAAIAQGLVSITPLRLDLTDSAMVSRLEFKDPLA